MTHVMEDLIIHCNKSYVNILVYECNTISFLTKSVPHMVIIAYTVYGARAKLEWIQFSFTISQIGYTISQIDNSFLPKILATSAYNSFSVYEVESFYLFTGRKHFTASL